MKKRRRNYTQEEMEIAHSTARRRGAVGPKALVPRVIEKLTRDGTIFLGHKILDFGAGPGEHAQDLASRGFIVHAHELPTSRYYDPVNIHDPRALEKKYDVIYMSNVLNVLPSLGFIDETLTQVYNALKEDGFIVANYPESPRKGPEELGFRDRRLGQEKMREQLERYFFSVQRVPGFGTKQAPVWIISGKRHLVRNNPLRDVPIPPPAERPEMWTPESIVQAVKDGFGFGIPFLDKVSYSDPNAYYIKGQQYFSYRITVSPEHSPDIQLLDDGWIGFTTYFSEHMVPEEAWLKPPNEHGVVPVWVEINPEDIDWEILNRGYQVRGRMP